MSELALLRPAFVEQMAAAAGKAARVEAHAQAGTPGTFWEPRAGPREPAGVARRCAKSSPHAPRAAHLPTPRSALA